MKLRRASGILLHPTSLPGQYGIGDLGREAYGFVDQLKRAKQSLWQVLPLNPPGLGGSPYQCPSAFAGNHYLISPEALVEEDLLQARDLADCPSFPTHKVVWELVGPWKEGLLRKAFNRFRLRKKNLSYGEFLEENAGWLEDYAIFMALKAVHGNQAWNYWPEDLARREPKALSFCRLYYQEEIAYHCFLQYLFFKQWRQLKSYANGNGIEIIGDVAIFVSYDSSDTWAQPELFALDERGNPTKVAGVPPDYFSATGQLWGNPHYDWAKMAENHYLWWRERFKIALQMADYVRVDHFRGFEAYWEIPAGEETAVNGQWVKGPGEHFFDTMRMYLGDLPIIAEDLGIITDQVRALKDRYQFPGMKVLQFISEEPIPQEEENVVYYTGTHDNDTLLGWYKERILGQLERNYMKKAEEICQEFIELVYASLAPWAILPLQDVLVLDSEARMNVPGTIAGNWQWRLEKGAFTENHVRWLGSLAEKYRRS